MSSKDIKKRIASKRKLTELKKRYEDIKKRLNKSKAPSKRFEGQNEERVELNIYPETLDEYGNLITQYFGDFTVGTNFQVNGVLPNNANEYPENTFLFPSGAQPWAGVAFQHDHY